MTPSEQQRHDRLMQLAVEAFASHELRQHRSERWLIQRCDAGRWSGFYSAEIIDGAHGELIVTGDINHVIFAGGDKCDPRDRVRWIGRCESFDYYVRQKAVIGTGRELIETYDADVARDGLAELRAERLEALRERGLGADGDRFLGIYEEAASYLSDRSELVSFLCDRGIDPEVLEDLGVVIAPRLYYAYAACRRLSEIFDAQEAEGSRRPGTGEAVTV